MADAIFNDPRLGSGIEGPGYIVLTTAEALGPVSQQAVRKRAGPRTGPRD
jgi:hypothetical protein